MSLQEIKINKILDTNGYIERNPIHEDSILRFIPTKELENDYILMVDNKITTVRRKSKNSTLQFKTKINYNNL